MSAFLAHSWAKKLSPYFPNPYSLKKTFSADPIYQNNVGLKPRLLRRNIFGAGLKSPTSPPGRGYIKSGSISVIRLGDTGTRRHGDTEMGRHGDGEMEKYLVMIEDRTFFYTELNGFDIRGGLTSDF